MPHALVAVVLFFVYALMKRVTYYPQVVLGFPFAWAVFFCVAALGMDPLGEHVAPTIALFGANILWTITYDTIYAHQDVADDEKAGVKGMALRFRNSTKLLSSILAAGQVGLLALCGVWAGFHTVYFVGTVGGVAATMAYYIYDVDLKQPASCGAWFHRQFWTVGAGFMAGAHWGVRIQAHDVRGSSVFLSLFLSVDKAHLRHGMRGGPPAEVDRSMLLSDLRHSRRYYHG